MKEIKMMEIMSQMTDKVRWNEKVFDEQITARWRAEILRMEDDLVSGQMIDWVIAFIFRSVSSDALVVQDLPDKELLFFNSSSPDP